jgi:hypothetical protein
VIISIGPLIRAIIGLFTITRLLPSYIGAQCAINSGQISSENHYFLKLLSFDSHESKESKFYS